eukprot:12831459-Alexandrium_andersonii.AAC.1
MDPRLLSQMILAFCAIVRCGRDRDVFDTTALKIYGKFMKNTPEIAVSLFCAFRACAETSPNYESKSNSVRKGKRKPDKKAPRPGNGTGEASSSSG